MFGVKTDYKVKENSIMWIEPVLIQWLKIHREYIEEFSCEDALYWYNERANVSTLAGAMWKCGGFALEEYSSLKGEDDDTQKKGRVDLYLYNHGKDAICEAKMKWLFLCKNQRLDFPDALEKTIQDAVNSLNETLAAYPEKTYGIALNFVTAYHKNGEDVSNSLEKLWTSVKKSKCSFYALFENDSGNNIVSSTGNIFNFIALIGTVIKK